MRQFCEECCGLALIAAFMVVVSSRDVGPETARGIEAVHPPHSQGSPTSSY
jgi:hypothetical protein